MAHPTRIFHEPEEMYAQWIAYKEHLLLEAKNWPKIQYVGKDGEKKTDYPILPMTQSGFEVFCYDRVGCVEQYFKNKGGLYNDFVPICSRIVKERSDHQITGGMLNMFNPSITQRLNGLADKNETTIKEEPRVFKVD